MNDPIESRLQSLHLQPLPASWRDEILSAPVRHKHSPPGTVSRRLGWAVGLAWAAIFVLRLSTPADPASPPLSGPQLVQSYTQRLELLTTLLHSREFPTLP